MLSGPGPFNRRSRRGGFGLPRVSRSPSINVPLFGSTVARKRIPGNVSSANNGSITVVTAMRAPAAFDQVRIILHVAQTNLPGSAVKLTVAPSARAGNNPVTAANANVSWTPVTFSGASSVTVMNAPASADGGGVESDYVSDLIPLASLDRADTPGALPLIHVRCWASTYCPAANLVNGGPGTALEPDLLNGTYSGDQTTAVVGAPSNGSFHPAITIVFYLRGARVVTIGSAGDSTMQGSWNASTAADGSTNKFNGFPRQFKDILIANGIPASVEQMCLHGNSSANFHETARNSLNNLNGEGLTHLMVFPYSVNDGGSDATKFAQAKARILTLIDLAVSKGVVPIICRNPPGYESAAGQANGYNAFLDQIAADGKAVVYDPRPAMGLATTGYPAMPDNGRLHDSSNVTISNDTHPNNYYHSTVAADMYAKRIMLRITT